MKRALVAIGVDKTGDLPKLQAAADGAEEIAAWADGQGFDTTLLTDGFGPVRLLDVTTAIQKLVAMRVYDQIVVYFSGHGILKGPNYEVWLLSGAPTNANEAVNVTGSIALARNCGIRHVVFISDACRSIPDTTVMNYVLGGVIFPAEPHKAPSPEVDTFYAAVPGDPALELPPDEAAARHRGVFTDCLVEALLGKVNSVVVEFAGSNGTRRVIPSRPLKRYLLDAVPEAASAVSIKLQQHPEVRVESDLPNYLAEVVGPPAALRPPAPRTRRSRARSSRAPSGRAPTPRTPTSYPPMPNEERSYMPMPSSRKRVPGIPSTSGTRRHAARPRTATPRSPSTTEALETLKLTHFLDQAASSPRESVATAEVQAVSDEIHRLVDARGRPGFETKTGFTVHGANVVSAVCAGTSCEVFQENGLSHVRVDPLPQDGRPPNAAGSTVMRFDTGTGTCLAALPGYVGTVVLADNGRIVSVTYTPAEWTDEHHEYVAAAENVERRRAFAAVASRHGAFSLDREEARDAAHYLRVLKSIDPTLGIYAAYAYAQAGDPEGVDSVFAHMLDSPHGARPTIPFDVAMLAARDGTGPEPFMCPPTMPMLTQGWALLGGMESKMSEAALEARYHLIPSLWTAFTAEGISILEDAVTSGAFRWN